MELHLSYFHDLSDFTVLDFLVERNEFTFYAAEDL